MASREIINDFLLRLVEQGYATTTPKIVNKMTPYVRRRTLEDCVVIKRKIGDTVFLTYVMTR